MKNEETSNLWVWVVMFVLWLFFGFYGIVGFCVVTGLVCLAKHFDGDDVIYGNR